MSIEYVTLILILSAFVLFAVGFPIAFALGAVGVIYSLVFFGPRFLPVAAQAALGSMTSFLMVAIAGFVFMGMILRFSGVAAAMYDTMSKWMGRLNGGLAIGTVLVSTAMAAMVGIISAGIMTAGTIAMPEMLRRKYDKRMVLGSIMSGGVLGTLIPPSVPMILYALYSRQSIGRLFAGGMIPGLILSSLYCTYIGIRCLINPKMGPALPPEERVSWKKKVISLKDAVLFVLLIVGVLGSIFGGLATPTEASAVGALGAALIAAIYGKLSWAVIREACYGTMKLLGMVLWIMVGIGIFNSFFMAIGGADLVKNLVVGISPWTVLIGMQISLFLLGMVMDDYAIVMIATPLYAPVIISLGFDPIWFGVLFIINMGMGMMTPPYGFAHFYMKAVVPKDILMSDIWRSVLPFVGLQVVGLVLAMAFPQLVLWLPGLIFKSY